jgi:hypothetical protein
MFPAVKFWSDQKDENTRLLAACAMADGRSVSTVASRKEMTVKLARAFLTLFPTIVIIFFNVLVVLGSF